jgi:hypothetical protein
MEKTLLWRVTYTRKANLKSDSFTVGPWHPDRSYVERCAASLARQMPVGLQNNQQAARGDNGWPVGGSRSPHV